MTHFEFIRSIAYLFHVEGTLEIIQEKSTNGHSSYFSIETTEHMRVVAKTSVDGGSTSHDEEVDCKPELSLS